jgi:hypothetical protein
MRLEPSESAARKRETFRVEGVQEAVKRRLKKVAQYPKKSPNDEAELMGRFANLLKNMAGPTRLELATSCVAVVTKPFCYCLTRPAILPDCRSISGD